MKLRPNAGESRVVILLGLALVAGSSVSARGQSLGPASQGQVTCQTLLSMPPEYLFGLYRSSTASPIAPGPIRGRLLSRTGTALAPALSRGGVLVWQGKRFEADQTAINRFGGLPIVRGAVSFGPSWLDGAPALILDYEHTSFVYRKYRDEIREVAPGLYLGLMFDRTVAPPRLIRFFALERGA